MENKFEEKIPGLESYRWISVEETSKELEISKRTVFQYLKDGRIKGTKDTMEHICYPLMTL